MNAQSADSMFVGPGYQTKTERAIQAIRDAILRGSLHPDHQWTVGELAEQLGMSPTPVREAIRILQAEGLLRQTPHHTITPITFTEQDIIDVFELRVLLEGLATRLAATRMSDAQFARAAATLERMRIAYSAQDWPGIHRLNAEWHLGIYHACDNPILVESIQNLWKKFLWEALWSLPTHSAVSITQHAAILAALQDRDEERSVALMATHLRHGESSAVQFAQSQRARPAERGDQGQAHPAVRPRSPDPAATTEGQDPAAGTPPTT